MNVTNANIGNLTDGEIGAEMAAGRLVRNGEQTQIGSACYELRMGRVYYDLTEGARRFELDNDGKVLIKARSPRGPYHP